MYTCAANALPPAVALREKALHVMRRRMYRLVNYIMAITRLEQENFGRHSGKHKYQNRRVSIVNTIYSAPRRAHQLAPSW